MNLTINGRQVTVDDSFRNLSREDQDATVEEISKSLPADTKPASGPAAGLARGVVEPIEGLKETAKRFAGVGPGRSEDPNYVPANVTNGSWNPANWNVSQIPQKVAEMAPSVAAGSVAAAAGAKAGKAFGAKGKLLGALIGAGLYGTGATAGDTAKEVTAARTGDQNAESSTADLLQGGATAAAASAANAVLPTRLVPGINKAVGVGVQGAGSALSRLLGTTAIGGAGNVAADAITQAGTTIGGKEGLTIDPSRFPEAAVAGAATGATMASPKAAGDIIRAASMREHGGVNLDATKNYATRLEAAGDGNLGSKMGDVAAHETVKADLKNELRDAASKVRTQKNIGPDADNALQRAQEGKTLAAKDIDLIERSVAGAPDGDNAAFLARSLRMAQLAEGHGRYSAENGWAGGISGAMEKSVGYMLNPMRLAGGGIATYALGLNPLGLLNPKMAGAMAAGYGGARMIDGMTGMRSPAKTYAEHFADSTAQLRKPTAAPQAPQGPAPAPTSPWGPRPPMAGPTGPQVAPPTPQQAPQGPWGPKPLPTTAVPQVAAPGPAPAPSPQFNPIALMMLKERFKQQGADAKVEQVQALSENKARDAAALAALKQQNANFKVNQVQAESENKYLDNASRMTRSQADSENKTRNADYRVNQQHAESVNRNMDREAAAEEKAAAKEADVENKLKLAAIKAASRKPAAASLSSAASPSGPTSMADILRNVTADVTAPKKIKKANGKVETEAPKPTKEERKPFEPFDDEDVLYPRGISAKAYGEGEAARKGTSNERYKKSAERTAKDWIKSTNLLSAKYPGYKPSFESTLHHLLNIGSNVTTRREAIDHFASHVPDDVAQAMREAYK